MFERGLIIYPNDPLRILAVTWNAQGRPSDVQICYRAPRGARCSWHTREGITLGTTLRELVRWNGRHFRLIRWGTDGGGFVTSFAGGKLAYAKTKPGQLEISLDSPEGIRLTRAEKRSVNGSAREVSSSLPAMRKLNPRVWRLGMFFSY